MLQIIGSDQIGAVEARSRPTDWVLVQQAQVSRYIYIYIYITTLKSYMYMKEYFCSLEKVFYGLTSDVSLQIWFYQVLVYKVWFLTVI